MALVNVAKPVTALVNAIKASFGETWMTIPTTWASETRTWSATGSLFGNISKSSTSITNVTKPS